MTSNLMNLARLARIAIRRQASYEEFKYSDYLYGKEDMIDEVWELVEEARDLGMNAFDAKYPVCPTS